MKIIQQVGEKNSLYSGYVGDSISKLKGRYDLKYWPTIEDVIREISLDAEKADIYATDPLTEAATDSTRSSKADFLKAFLAFIRENSSSAYCMLPLRFEISDKSIAEIMNSALNLRFDQLVDAQYVKRARQRQREQQTTRS